MNGRYQEMAPHPALSGWVAAFWQLHDVRRNVAPPIQRVLPDGCVDIVFDWGQWESDGRADAAARLIGTMTRAVVVPSSGVADFFGIRFKPGVIGSLTSCAGRELQDRSADLPGVGMHLSMSHEQLFLAGSLAERVRLVTPMLQRYLVDRPPGDAVVREAIAIWRAAIDGPTGPLPTVSLTARSLGISERGLERRFDEWVGYRPAQFRRLVRFRSALRVSKAGRIPWAEVAARCGYADQAHLSRDFSDFALTTATGWAAEQRAVGFVQDSSVAAL